MLARTYGDALATVAFVVFGLADPVEDAVGGVAGDKEVTRAWAPAVGEDAIGLAGDEDALRDQCAEIFAEGAGADRRRAGGQREVAVLRVTVERFGGSSQVSWKRAS